MPITLNATHTLTLPWVKEATEGFVFCDDMRVAVSLALAARLNLIFSGPGGHAKSEFLETVFGAITGQETYVKSFGQGTSPEELFGGIDFDALNRPEGAALIFNPEHSFLGYKMAILEELFDAPSRVLTTLKDTLTAKELRNGRQRYPMQTRVIAAATNHSPQEIAEGGPEIEALIQRFPIQLEVKWPVYNKSSFLKLFTTVLDRKDGQAATSWENIEALQNTAANVTASYGIQSLLAHILVEMTRDGVSISPRTAMMALQLTKAAAAINGRERIVPYDINAIAYLPGALRLRERISDLISELAGTIEAEEKLAVAGEKLAILIDRFKAADAVDDLSEIASEASSLAQHLSALRVSADQSRTRRDLYESATSLSVEAGDAQTLIELKKLEEVLLELQNRLNQLDTVEAAEKLRDETGAVIDHAMNRRVCGQHGKLLVNKIINEAQALLQLINEELTRLRLEAGIDENKLRLAVIASEISKINRRLGRWSLPAEDRQECLGQIHDFERELDEMLVSPALRADHDAVVSKVKVIMLNNR
jgi:MoxR-like ATPase